MATNISKYVQLNDFLLLEYEFNKSSASTDLSGINSYVAETFLGRKQYYNSGSSGSLNNDLYMNSQPTTSNRSSWYITDNNSDISEYYSFFDSSTLISQANYQFDTVKVHIVSGYNFDDIPGFLLQIGAKDTSGNIVDLSNFTWINQVLGNNVIRFAANALYLGNRFYDKYVELKIPSVQALGENSPSTDLGDELLIAPLSDVYITYSTIPQIDNGIYYIVSERIEVQLPVQSQADNFNAFIAESTAGDFIEFYATWNSIIIGEYMGDIESGRIRLYTSNNPNDNFDDFYEAFGAGAQKWVVMHELFVYEHIPGGTLLTQQYVFTQQDNFTLPNYFRPVIKNSDIASAYTIEYVCRLTNRMDGTQIIRKASFASTDPKKYGRSFQRLNVDNYIPYKVFNRIEGDPSPEIAVSDNRKTKFVKVFFDTSKILLNTENEVLPQGTGPLFLKRSDGVYKFKFEKINENADDERINVDLSGVYNYILHFSLDDDSIIEILPTYSQNMNTTLGELEFKIQEEQSQRLLRQSGNDYAIMVKNPDGSRYTFYEGKYYPFTKTKEIVREFSEAFGLNKLQKSIAEKDSTILSLRRENATLKRESR